MISITSRGLDFDMLDIINLNLNEEGESSGIYN